SVDFLRVLTDEQRLALATQTRQRLYAAGEVILHEGDTSAELFILESGEVIVFRTRGPRNAEQVLARLGPGKIFGEMAPTTGAPRNAAVRAATQCVLLVLGHAPFKALLESAPEVAEHVSRVIAERRSVADASDEAATPTRVSVEERSSQLLGMIRRFF